MDAIIVDIRDPGYPHATVELTSSLAHSFVFRCVLSPTLDA